MPERRLIVGVLLALGGVASADTCPTPPLRTHEGDTVTVLGCVAGHFPATGVAVLAQVTPQDLSDDPSDDAPHAVAISLVFVTAKGKLSMRGPAERYGAWALDATSFGTLFAVDLDGDGSDEVIVPDDSNVDGTTAEDLLVYGRVGKRVRRVGSIHTASDDTATYDDSDRATVCTSTMRVGTHRLILDGTVKAGPTADAKNAAACIDGHREYRLRGGKLHY